MRVLPSILGTGGPLVPDHDAEQEHSHRNRHMICRQTAGYLDIGRRNRRYSARCRLCTRRSRRNAGSEFPCQMPRPVMCTRPLL